VIAMLFLVGLVVACYVGLRFMSAYRQAQDLVPQLQDKMAVLQVTPSRIVSADGVTLYQITDVYRKPIGDYNKIPLNMRNAIIAAEDKRFFEHSGVDPWGIARAVFGFARNSKISGGGSTITMQLAKRLFSHGEQTFDRKMQDIALAIAIEQKFSKEQILTMYLDQVYFGSGAYGVQAASEIYFGKSVNELSLSQCAILARCVQRPSDVNPYANLDRSIENRNVVLSNMLEMGAINQEQYSKAVKEKVKLRQKTAPQLTVDLQRAPYFVQHVLEVLHDKYQIDLDDLKMGGYTIKTTLDSKLESVAEEQVRKIVRDYAGEHVRTAAFVVMDKEGQIKAEVGGVSYRRSNFNIVTHGMRQPGSSFKPFVYSAAFDQGKLDLYGALPNSVHTFEYRGQKWTPHNSGRANGGMVSVRSAFMYSMNIPAAHVMEMVGPDSAVQYANSQFGFTSPFRPYMSLVLGAQDVRPLEMAQAYSTFMLRGDRATPYCITEIETPDGQKLEEKPVIVPNALNPEVSDKIDALMRAVVYGGTGKEARDIPNARGKTGTTSDNKDAWFCGYTDGMVGIGWIANERIMKNGRAVYGEMGRQVFGGTVTVKLWKAIMSMARDRFGTQMADRPLADSFGQWGGGSEGGTRRHQSTGDGTPATPDDTPATDPDSTPFPDSVPPIDDGGGATPAPPTNNGDGTDNGAQVLYHRRR